jgi:hypothetical protein
MHGTGEEAQKEKLLFFKFLGLGRRGPGWVTFRCLRLIACVASRWLVETGEVEGKIKGRALVGRNGLQKKRRIKPSVSPTEGSALPSASYDSGSEKL